VRVIFRDRLDLRRRLAPGLRCDHQEYQGYPPANIRNGGKFNGMMLEGVIAF
jgi:hypothetical protein